uniref:Lipocalin/cytosolic fatty-acid binding domain-containing protein n=1 Tax=Graphocephala atropunctata TaxID=36148 RepID=A0A1B6LQY1_9HEMI
MAVLHVLLVLPLFAAIRVDATGKCNQDIIKKILATNSCPSGVLGKLHDMGQFTQAALPAAEVPDVVQCWGGSIDAPTGSSANAQAKIIFKDGSEKTIKYITQEQTCGQITDSYEGSTYNIYFMNIDDTIGCYYRCNNEIETAGADFGGCVIPESKVTDPAAQVAIAKCKQSLADVGITTSIQNLQPCSQ